MTEMIAATFGPDSALPTCSQFFLLCTRVHNRNYAESMIMRSQLLASAA